MFIDLGLPTFATIISNAKFGLQSNGLSHVKLFVTNVYDICAKQVLQLSAS